jgi:ABC-type phosphate/phosphonate transport system substrate-binding protein
MYSFGEVATANVSLWSVVSDRLRARGLDMTDVRFDPQRKAVPEEIGSEIFLTQVCGYPLIKKFQGQARLLAAPLYRWAGCVGATHRAYFIVRAEDGAGELKDMKGRVFGCNSLLSNSGMNLPRLRLARLGVVAPFFSRVVMTGGHRDSIEQLIGGAIDLCSVDCVTWGLFTRYAPEFASRCRVLDETPSSPSLPFVTSMSTAESDANLLADTLHSVMRDPASLHAREVLGLTGFAVPNIQAYEQLAQYEREATEHGYPEIA